MHVFIIGAYGGAGVSAAEELVNAEDGTVLGYQGRHYHADAMAKTMQVLVELDVRAVPDRVFHRRRRRSSTGYCANRANNRSRPISDATPN